MRSLTLIFFVVMGAGLPSPARAAARWEEVLLVDWIYPGEESYVALKDSALELGSSDWIVARLKGDEKVPQASARDLAFRLSRNPRISSAKRENLLKLFPDEAALLKETGDLNHLSRTKEIAAEFDAMSRRMDEIDAIFKKNNYGKGDVPSVSITVFSGYTLESPAGLIAGNMKSKLLGGVEFTLDGTVDKAAYNFTWGGGYHQIYEDQSFTEHSFASGASFSFVLPLGNNGLEVHLGATDNLNFSHLIYSSLGYNNRDLFFVNFEDNYRGAKEVKELVVGYPSTEFQATGVYISTQGASVWWPFSSTRFDYSPDIAFWEPYTAIKKNIWALRVDEELGPRGSLFDNIIFYGVLVGAGNDHDQTEGLSVFYGINTPDTQSALSEALGAKIQLSTGSSLNIEWAAAHYVRSVPNPVPANATLIDVADTAVIATLAQPIGPVTVGLELGMAGPYFHTDAIGTQSGAVWDSSAPLAGKASFEDWQVPDGVPISDLGWSTVVSDPNLLSNNTQRAVLKAQWSGSWLSLGIYDGVVPEINPSGPFVHTIPFIEGRGENGYGWYRAFGQNYWRANAPFGPVGPGPGFLYQSRYNQSTDAMAVVDDAGTQLPAHWHEVTQTAYRQGDFILLLSKNGVGDNRVMPDSLKTINYAGGTAKMDFKSIANWRYPFDLVLTGEVRDVAANAGLPAVDASNYFNQQISTGQIQFGLTDRVDLFAIAGLELWQSHQSLFPIFAQTREFGLGADFNLDPVLTGLKIQIRSSWMNHEDLMRSEREFSLWTLGLGTFLTY